MEAPHNQHYRKIELQCPADLTYLLTNIKKAAQDKIDLAIPPPPPPPLPPSRKATDPHDAGQNQQQQQQEQEQEPDAYRIRVEELVMEYIQQTLALALPSLSINGLPVPPSSYLRTKPSPSSSSTNPSHTQDPNDPFTDTSNNLPGQDSEEVYEPYDPRLAERLRALHAQLEDEQTKVAELRREAPALAASAYAEVLARAMERDRSGGLGEMAAPPPLVEDDKDRVKVEGEMAVIVERQLDLGTGLQRREDVEAMYSRAVAGLTDLGEVTGVLARLERAEKAAAVVLGERDRDGGGGR